MSPLKLLVYLGIFSSLLACSPAPQVKTVKVESGVVESVVSSVNSGTVRSEKIAELSFGTVGRVSKLNVSLGDQVKGGAVLAELENDDLISAYKTAQRENERRKTLERQKVVSPSESEEMIKLEDAAKAALEKAIIRAPFDGVITECNLEIGQLSQITAVVPKPLLKIVDLGPRYVRAEIDEVDLPKVRVGLLARVKILAVRKEPFKASVRKVVPYVSTIREQDRTSEIELSIDSEGILLPVGASGDVEIVTDRRDDVIFVPSRALIGRSQSRYVFVKSGSRAVKRNVIVGLFNYDRAEILSGLSKGEEVILPTDEVSLEDGMKIRG